MTPRRRCGSGCGRSAVNILLNLLLSRWFSHVGVALATTLSAWFNALLLGGVLVRRGQLLPDRRLRERAPRLLLAAALMGVALLGAEFVLFPVASGPLRLLALVALVGGGVAVYFGAAQLMRGFDLREFRALLRRRRTHGRGAARRLDRGRGRGRCSAAMKQRVFSGIQPSGVPTLGNYLGAIRNWVPLQDTHDAIYCVVDLHAITVWQDPKELATQTREMAAALIACGLDPRALHLVRAEPCACACAPRLDLQLRRPARLAEPDDAVQGQGGQGPRGGLGGALRLSEPDGGRHPGLPRHQGAGGR